MKISVPVAVRDLYSDDLRDALSRLARPGEAHDGDIVAIARPIVYFEEEQHFDHRYSGRFYELKGDYLWPKTLGSMRRVWRAYAEEVSVALRNCRTIEFRTGVAILLARDRGHDVSEVTVCCSGAGVVWRYDELDWSLDFKADEEIKFGVREIYGAYLDEAALEDRKHHAIWELGKIMKGLIMLDAYNIMGEAGSKDDAHARLAKRLAAIEIELEEWHPDFMNHDSTS